MKVKNGRIFNTSTLALKIGTGNTGYWQHSLPLYGNAPPFFCQSHPLSKLPPHFTKCGGRRVTPYGNATSTVKKRNDGSSLSGTSLQPSANSAFPLTFNLGANELPAPFVEWLNSNIGLVYVIMDHPMLMRLLLRCFSNLCILLEQLFYTIIDFYCLLSFFNSCRPFFETLLS